MTNGTPKLAHDLNNILTIIAGYAEVIIDKDPNGPCIDDVREIRQAAKRAIRLTSEFAAYRPVPQRPILLGPAEAPPAR